MAYFSGDSILLSVGTRAGLYLLEGDSQRAAWRKRGPYLASMDIQHAILDGRDGRTLYAAGTGSGSTAVYRSDDRGETWSIAGQPFDAEQVWHVEPATEHEPGVVYAGVMPAALYRSADRGDSWNEIAGLTSHPTREEWEGGGGGLCLHTILTDPNEPEKLAVGISAVGWFASDDGGKSWEARNNGVMGFADVFAQEMDKIVKYPEIHRCVHKAVRHPANGLLYQQNHLGVYKSEDYGAEWIDISDGLPNPFGFVIGITADGTVYVVPQHDWEEEIGVRITGQLTVCRMRHDSGMWEHLSNGLPEVRNMTLYREGMATDHCSPGGVYFGTSDGNLYGTADGGDSWTAIASELPSIRSVSCEHYTI
ncbi:sialidase family protein [soil metagenome]